MNFSERKKRNCTLICTIPKNSRPMTDISGKDKRIQLLENIIGRISPALRLEILQQDTKALTVRAKTDRCDERTYSLNKNPLWDDQPQGRGGCGTRGTDKTPVISREILQMPGKRIGSPTETWMTYLNLHLCLGLVVGKCTVQWY